MDSRLVVDDLSAGLRLDIFLVKNLAGYSRSQIQKLIKAGNIIVGGKQAAPHYAIKANDKIEVNLPEEKTLETAIPQIEIIAETPEFAIINKPAGIVVHPDSKHKSGTTVDFLVEKYPEIKDVGDDVSRPGIVHRLDKDASGLMVAVRTQKSFENLKKQFQDRAIEKEYLILAHDPDLPDMGEITTSLSRSKVSGKIVARSDIAAGAKAAHTIYNVLERRKNFALISVKTKTGRTHQIRVHFNSIGHSVAGDKLYKQKQAKGKINPPRLFLHAAKLSFIDIHGERQRFQLTLAEDLQNFWDSLK